MTRLSPHDARFGWVGIGNWILTERVVPGRVMQLLDSDRPMRVVAVEGAINDWTAYALPADEADTEETALHGDKLFGDLAVEIFPFLKRDCYRA